MRLAVVLIAAAALGCAQDPLADKVATRDARPGEPTGPALVATLMRVAVATEQAGDAATAASFYRKAHEANVQLGRKDAAPLVGLGRALLALGAHNEAAGTFRTALDLAPEDPAALRGLGNTLIAMDQPMAAVTNLEAALAKAPDVQIYSSLGVAYDLLDRRAAAQAAYRKGLELDSGNLALRNNLGLSLAFSGAFDEAIVILERVAADPRATLRQKMNLALAYGLAGDFEIAEDILARYLDAGAVANNLAYYKTLRALQDRKLAARSVGVGTGTPAGGLAATAAPDQPTPPAPDTPPQSAAVPQPPAAEAPPPPPATGKPVELMPQSPGKSHSSMRSSDPLTVETSRLTPGPPPSVEKEEGEGILPRQTPSPSMGVGRAGDETQDASLDPVQDPAAAAPAVTEAAEPPPRQSGRKQTAAGGPVQVQFAAFRSKEQAEASWRRLRAAAPDLLTGVAPSIEEGLSGADPNPYFRVRSAPLGSRAEAADLCARLKERKLDCMLVREPPKLR